MSATQKLQVKLTLTNGKTSIINLPDPVSDDLKVDGASVLVPSVHGGIVGAFATDDGIAASKIDVTIVKTETTEIAKDWDGTPAYDPDYSPSE